jgi:2-methylisocitrate lyase-like PEP mutase family enzyme
MSQTLRSMLQAGQFVAAPGVFDMFSAKIADRASVSPRCT